MSKPEFAYLLDELDELEALRSGGTLEADAAARRHTIERKVMEALTHVLKDDERRTHLRVECALEVRLHYGNSSVGGVLRDAGEGGVFVETPLSLDVGEKLEIEIPRRVGVLEQSLRVRGRIVWRLAPQATAGGFVGVGISFELGDEAQERRLRRFVLEMLRRRVQRASATE